MTKSDSLRVFISHASADKPFALLLATALRNSAMSPWIDKEQVLVGDDVLEKLGEGLRTMDLLVFIVSKKALQSRWVDRELKFAARREIEEKQVLILPFIIDPTSSHELPWYLHHLRAERVAAGMGGIAAVVKSVAAIASRRVTSTKSRSGKRQTVTRDPTVDRIIAGIGLGEWKKATAAALRILKETDAAGRNDTFEVLLTYQNLSSDDEVLWPALHTIEMCADLAPDLMSRLALSQMANHPNFSVRSSAASICMNWAQFAPDRVPVDVLVRLSVHDEDWYVQAPANAALKSMASAVPGVLEIFYSRLRSPDAEERAHAAACILDISKREPDLLDVDDLRQASTVLTKMADREALGYVRESLTKVKPERSGSRYKYGL
ncbi:MAG TPA: toll/interleukin-1 receptor domain-containing protein [Terriglobia bacterium]|nr:toll/interleukin-1 receptor domain-containing protein [Terriglobia bacterium]